MEGIMNSPSALAPIVGAPWKGVRYGCTTRNGGVSKGPWASLNLGLNTQDDPEDVAKNRRLLTDSLPSEPLWLRQVHGIEVVDADAMPAPVSSPPVADAAVTTTPGRVLAILTADCAPVVIADIDGHALGVAHAGWRGLAGGVLESLMAALHARCSDARGWRAWIGPCIGSANFEVGDDVHRAFVQPDPSASVHFLMGRQAGKWQADLAGLVAHRLAQSGIGDIERNGSCTFEQTDLLYSYRRSPITGRMATIAWLQPDSAASASA